MARIVLGLLLLVCIAAGPGLLARETLDGALTDLSGYVFVANRTSAEIAVIDVDRDAVVRQVALGGIPNQYVISDQLRKLAATHLAEETLSIADLGRGSFEVLPLGLVPEQLQIGPNGRLVAISSSREDRVLLVSLDTGKVLRTIAWARQPGDLMFDRSGQTLFIASRSEGRIGVADVASGTIRNEFGYAPEPASCRASSIWSRPRAASTASRCTGRADR